MDFNPESKIQKSLRETAGPSFSGLHKRMQNPAETATVSESFRFFRRAEVNTDRPTHD